MIGTMLLWISIIVMESLYDCRTIEYAKSRPNYQIKFILRGIAAIVHGAWLMDNQNWIQYGNLFVYQTSSYWIIFTPLLNYWRGLPYFYNGKNSGPIDKYLDGHPVMEKVLYIVFIILFVLSSISTYFVYGA